MDNSATSWLIRRARWAAIGTLTVGLLALAVTPPAIAQTTTIAVLADLSKLSIGRPAPVFYTVAGHAPDRVIWLGDRDHRFGWGANPSQAEVARMYCEVQGLTCAGAASSPAGQDWQASGLAAKPSTCIYSDHDSRQDNANKTAPGWPITVAAFQAAFPAPYASPNGIWHTLVEGPVRIIALDTRSQRDPPSATGSMLGAEQGPWFAATLAAATERWVLILSDGPLAPGAKPSDAWASLPAAQAAMESLLLAHCDGRCVVWGADMHINAGRRTAWGAEVSNPHANLGTGIKLWGSCGNNTQPTYCGTWDWMMQGKGRPGFGLLRATATSLTAEIRGAENDNIRWSVTLP